MVLHKKIDIASEKIINYRVSSLIHHHCSQINIIVREGPAILLIIHFFHSKIFKLLKPVNSYASILTSLYQFDKKLTKQFEANIYMFKVRIVTLR